MIVYLHGFRSAPASIKARALGHRMEARGLVGQFWCEMLPASPREAIALVERQLLRCMAKPSEPAPALVGSSLGGYYATWLAQRYALRAVVVNPAVVAPLSLEAWVGEQTNMYTGETFDFKPQYIEDLRALEVERITHPENFWLLVETGDEVLDYREAVRKYAGARQTVLEGGDHSFTRWNDYLDEVIRFAGPA